MEKVQILNRYGLHGRPTTMFVKLANRFEAEVRVCRDGDTEEVDGKSALALLSLGVDHGGVLQIKARGRDAREAVQALAALVRNRFQEE